MERERAAGSWTRSRAYHRLLWQQRNAPAHFAQYQSTDQRRSAPVPDCFQCESDCAELDTQQHHPDREHRELELQRTLGDRDQTIVARLPVQRVVYVLEVD